MDEEMDCFEATDKVTDIIKEALRKEGYEISLENPTEGRSMGNQFVVEKNGIEQFIQVFLSEG